MPALPRFFLWKPILDFSRDTLKRADLPSDKTKIKAPLMNNHQGAFVNCPAKPIIF
ncbi:hypothetical protein [Bartonella sp. HY406]|uniref:hypothetical protein n=1 Tax=Bartonella sp. HY406 TaxID=2979331 RepID=UPI0021C65B31|nr:hypothetical protein [Bartonella sp. HY406]UXN04615.1 hypothetical protein N6B01_06295 [Bartonella sp. HY406]